MNNQQNVSFADFITLVEAFGFIRKRVNGSHHIYKCPGITDMVNIQNKNGMAKAYQVKQFLSIVERYNLQVNEE
ncbi:MAG TPA: type II toxin-antitoxin system HicA family toxin [Candidatus Kapabacteria bacterium]|nr:type II toxin-antitoxin system HicA family toxin [Candidatus Kapabacteria bacterium]